MKKIFGLLLSILSINSYAYSFQDVEITCDYEYETYSSVDEITKTFTIEGKRDLSGNIIFFKRFKNLPAYFFPEDRYGAYWHKDSEIAFFAVLTGQILTYEFEFKNYARNLDDFGRVFKEKRLLDMSEHFAEQEYDFDYKDGDILDQEINNGPWINERHIQIDDCELKFK